jgi:hypothetical protein
MPQIFAMLMKGQQRGGASLGLPNWTKKARKSRSKHELG